MKTNARMITIHDNYSLLPHNTFHINATARHFITYESIEDLQQITKQLHSCHTPLPILHIGAGSNLLFLKDFDGIILHSAIKTTEIIEENSKQIIIRAGAAVLWDELVTWCTAQGFYGLENLSLIPGETGAAAIQNIGAYGIEAKDVIEQVETVNLYDGSIKTFNNKDCAYGYRSSIFKQELQGHYAVTHVQLRLAHKFTPNISYGNIRETLYNKGIDPNQVTAAQMRQTICDIRRAKLPDPNKTGNAGSFFKNPFLTPEAFERLQKTIPNLPHYNTPDGQVKVPAAKLIEFCGWKGRSLGRAAVYDKQALVLINKGGATGNEIYRLSKAISNDVFNKLHVKITPEVNIIGEKE